ncbi:MAG: hypothetical protein PHP37_04555, partial [Patescibacteria group bacterium]|nr:hypothetical protein [Patescibacteria group bacterium]
KNSYYIRRAMALSKKISLIVVILGIVFLFGFKGVYPAKAADVPKPETYFCKDSAQKGSVPGSVKVRITKVSVNEKSDKKSDTNWYSATITWQLSGTDAFNGSKYGGKYNYEPGNITRTASDEKKSGTIGVGHGIYKIKDAVQLKPNSTLKYQFEKFKICWQETVSSGMPNPTTGVPTSTRKVDYYAEIESTPVSVQIGSDGKAGEATGEDGTPIDSPTSTPLSYDACMQDYSLPCESEKCCGSQIGHIIDTSIYKAGALPTMAYVKCWISCEIDQALSRWTSYVINTIVEDALGI